MRINHHLAGLHLALAISVVSLVSACGGGAALQPDRSVFGLDNSYQRHNYEQPIEDTFDRTVAMFKEAGYGLDVIDRATGRPRRVPAELVARFG